MFHLLWHNITLSQPAPHLNAKMNLLLLLMTFHLTMEPADGNTRATLLMFKKSPSQHATPLNSQKVNVKKTVPLPNGMSQLTMEIMNGKLEEVPPVMLKESQFQLVTLLNTQRENAKRTVLLRSGTSHLLLRKNPSQHATLSSMLKANAKRTA